MGGTINCRSAADNAGALSLESHAITCPRPASACWKKWTRKVRRPAQVSKMFTGRLRAGEQTSLEANQRAPSEQSLGRQRSASKSDRQAGQNLSKMSCDCGGPAHQVALLLLLIEIDA